MGINIGSVCPVAFPVWAYYYKSVITSHNNLQSLSLVCNLRASAGIAFELRGYVRPTSTNKERYRFYEFGLRIQQAHLIHVLGYAHLFILHLFILSVIAS